MSVIDRNTPKTLQIIPAPDNMYVRCFWPTYENNKPLIVDGKPVTEPSEEKVICLALTEDRDGYRSVDPMIFTEWIDFIDARHEIFYR